MFDGSHPARPARPVADAPRFAVGSGDALAKGWLLTLLAGAPLAYAGTLPAADMAARAPALCEAMVAALTSDAELERLEPGGDLREAAARAGTMTGAADPAAVVASLAALRASLWNAVANELRDPDPEIVAALAARLARICDVVAAAVFATAAAAEPVLAPASAAEPAPAAEHADHAPEPPTPEVDVPGPRLAAVPPAPAVPADVFPTATAMPPHGSAEPESWATVVVGRLSRLLAERASCAVLAVEVDDADRLLAADVRGEAAAMIERAERAIDDVLLPGHSCVREREGRVWIVASDTTLEAARALGRRVVAAVAAAGDLHGAPLRASIGIATSPPDGDDAASLIAHADEGVYAARAAGVSLA